ncbi:MAG TPA: hypothetical protein VGR28_15270 [Candidatus Thermoplasmatota archaeon]|jgi:hypothetical protein|nr:hypothetical protein [Candidatus Thermoplasmatota archaeon]
MRGALALAALLAAMPGCADVVDDLPAGASMVDAPRWTGGRWWNYTIEDGGGAAMGWINHTVIVERPVANVTERGWEVQTLRFDLGDVDHDGAPNQTVARDVLYDAATLNSVWNVCGTPYVFGACSGRDPELDFPLWDGKRWASRSGGDVIIDYDNRAFRATHEGRAVWRVEREALGVTGWPAEVSLYDPAVGFYVERVHPGFADETWRLRSWG